MYRITTFPTLHTLELGPEAIKIVAEAKPEPGVAHIVSLKSLGGDYVQVTFQGGSPPQTIVVLHDSALRELLEDGGPNAYLEHVSD